LLLHTTGSEIGSENISVENSLHDHFDAGHGVDKMTTPAHRPLHEEKYTSG